MQGDSKLTATGWQWSSLQIQRPDWSLVIECTVPAPPSAPLCRTLSAPVGPHTSALESPADCEEHKSGLTRQHETGE